MSRFRPIGSASYSYENAAGTTYTALWHTLEYASNGLKLYFTEADELFTPVYSWQQSAAGRVTFSLPHTAANFTLVSLAADDDDLNQLIDICNMAIFDKRPGTFSLDVIDAYNEIDGYLIPGNITNWDKRRGLKYMTFTFVPTVDWWSGGTMHPVMNIAAGGTATVDIDSQLGADVSITFIGTADAPSMEIAGNTYGFTALAARNAKINTWKKTATINGANAYADRIAGTIGSGSYIFETVPAGSVSITNNSSVQARVFFSERQAAPLWP